MGKTPTSEELRERLRKKAPEVLEAEMDFDSAIMRVLKSREKTKAKAPSNHCFSQKQNPKILQKRTKKN